MADLVGFNQLLHSGAEGFWIGVDPSGNEPASPHAVRFVAMRSQNHTNSELIVHATLFDDGKPFTMEPAETNDEPVVHRDAERLKLLGTLGEDVAVTSIEEDRYRSLVSFISADRPDLRSDTTRVPLALIMQEQRIGFFDLIAQPTSDLPLRKIGVMSAHYSVGRPPIIGVGEVVDGEEGRRLHFVPYSVEELGTGFVLQPAKKGEGIGEIITCGVVDAMSFDSIGVRRSSPNILDLTDVTVPAEVELV